MKKIFISLATTLAITASFAVMPALRVSANTPSSWAASEVSQAVNVGLVTSNVSENYQANITREQFCGIVVSAYEKFSGSTAAVGSSSFNDTSNAEVLKAAELGIVSGVGGGSFAPNNYITRQEIAAMLTRMIEKAVPSVNTSIYNNNSFSDSYLISDWALPYVNFVYDNGIMRGSDNNTIAPLDNTTCEEAVLLVYRTYKKYTGADEQSDNAVQSNAFIVSSTEDYVTYSINAYNHSIYYNSTGLYIDGVLYNSNADLRFLFNGQILYYSYGGSIYSLNFDTWEQTYVVYCMDGLEGNMYDYYYLSGCYNNQYLYYTVSYYGFDENVVIYDLTSHTVVSVVEGDGSVALSDSYLFITDHVTDVSEVKIYQMDFDGNNSKIIAYNAKSHMAAYGNKLYYDTMVDIAEDYSSWSTQIQVYDADTGTTTVLTDAYAGYFATKVTDTYATFTNAYGSFDVYY